MSEPRGIERGQALALARMLKLVLATPDLEVETERRARWLAMRLEELYAKDRAFLEAVAAIAPDNGPHVPAMAA